MSETTSPIASGAPHKRTVSREVATEQIEKLFAAFEVPLTIDDIKTGAADPHPALATLVRYVTDGRLVVDGDGDDITVTQHFRRTTDGHRSVVWNWHKLGTGKAAIKIDGEGIAQFRQHYQTAAPMIGIEAIKIQQMHPVDLTVVEDVVSFFRSV